MIQRAPAQLQRIVSPQVAPRLWIIALSLLAAGISTVNGFALDDVHLIASNERVHSLSGAWQLFGQTYWPAEQGSSLYRPLAMLAFAVQWAAGGGSPLPFHVVNVVLYTAISVALYRLALLVMREETAFIAAAIFAVHPVHVEAVANAVGQSELWAALLVLISVRRYVVARRGPVIGASEIAVLACLYIAACMFKEHAIVLPALFTAAEITGLTRSAREGHGRSSPVPLAIALLAAAFAFIVVRTMVVQGLHAGGTNELFEGQPFSARFFTMLTVVVEWVRILFWPAVLSADYSFPRTAVATRFEPAMLPALVVLCGCAFIAWSMRRRAPVVTFAILWTAFALAIPSNLVVVTGFVLAERTLFLASAGVALAVAPALWHLWASMRAREHTRIMAVIAFAAILAAGVARSAHRSTAWKNNEALFAQTVKDVPSSSRAHWMLAEDLWVSGRRRESLEELQMAVLLGRRDDSVLLGFAADRFNSAGMCPRAIGLYRRGLALTPGNVQLRVNYSLCLLTLGRFDEARALVLSNGSGSNDQRLLRVARLADSLAVERIVKLQTVGR